MKKKGICSDLSTELLLQITSQLNALLIIKYGHVFNVDNKAPSWNWVLKKLDEILEKAIGVKERR